MTFIDTIMLLQEEGPGTEKYSKTWILSGISLCQWVLEGMPAQSKL
jgi:hypothetical protein